jgi:hypothetical protein
LISVPHFRNAAQKPKRRRSKPSEPDAADESTYEFDRGTRRDELACAEYVVPLYEYYREAEVRLEAPAPRRRGCMATSRL